MLFTDKNENSKLYEHFFKNIQYKVYNIDNAFIIKMRNDSSNSGTKIIKMTHRLKWAKAKKDNQGLLSNSDAVREKFNKLKKLA